MPEKSKNQNPKARICMCLWNTIWPIEQPLKAGRIEETSILCKSTPLPIVLDEELIGIHTIEKKAELIKKINPQFIILKPSLTGGFESSKQWIDIAIDNGSDWWITSALESNIGLNAIAQWTYTLDHTKYHGLGTGKVFSNNIKSAIKTQGERIFLDKHDILFSKKNDLNYPK